MLTFTEVFKELNKHAKYPLFEFKGDQISPLNNRVRLIFIDSFLYPEKFSTLELSSIPKRDLSIAIKTNFFDDLQTFFTALYFEPSISSKKAVTDFAQSLESTLICIQEKKREEIRKSFLTSTEELGEFVAMLYLRNQGYIVQRPRMTYGRDGDVRPGVDDVVAWKSSILKDLKRYRFIEKGCHISELYCLRWLGRTSKVEITPIETDESELALVEVESSTANGLSSSKSKGINQLIRAEKLNIFNEMLICFPIVSEAPDEIFAQIRNKAKPNIKGLLFNESGLFIQDSGVLSTPLMFNNSSEISAYENELKKVLLNNFFYEEIIDMIHELGVDINNKGIHEVLTSFNKKIDEIPISYLLEKLDKIIE